MSVHIEFPFLPPSLNAAFNSTPRGRMGMRREVKRWAWASIHAANLSPIPGPVQLFYSFYGYKRSRDADNFITKWITDELVLCGVIPGDTMRHVTTVCHCAGIEKAPIKTILEIVETTTK